MSRVKRHALGALMLATLAGCGGSHTSVDTIGVKVTYQHTWLTSFARITGTGVTFTESAIARAEPQY